MPSPGVDVGARQEGQTHRVVRGLHERREEGGPQVRQAAADGVGIELLEEPDGCAGGHRECAPSSPAPTHRGGGCGGVEPAQLSPVSAAPTPISAVAPSPMPAALSPMSVSSPPVSSQPPSQPPSVLRVILKLAYPSNQHGESSQPAEPGQDAAIADLTRRLQL
eukprot:334726-Pleurochrysis_carterae.AAC.1